MISIIVCTYNRQKYIDKCLMSIANQTADKASYELIIINNNSNDQSHDIISDFISKQHKVIQCSYFIEQNQGLSFARNRGIKESIGNFYVFIDDDAFIEETYVTNLQTYLKQYGVDSIGFGGKIVPFLESALPNWMSSFLMPLMSVIDKGEIVSEFSYQHYPIGANMGMSKRAIDEIGNFNVTLGRVGTNLIGGEEKDLFIRMKHAGFRILYFPKIVAHHVVPDSRLTIGFIKQQALGIGISEMIRVNKEAGFSPLKRWLLELYKWIGSFGLFFIYLFKGQLSKGIMVIKFRWWVSIGMIRKDTH
jgi:glucosyl-dolichyl phosphate glucuronosyltransferase